MKKHEFYRKYANTPIGNRFEVINFIKHGSMTLNQIYQLVKENDEKIAGLEFDNDNLISVAEEALCKKPK